jgi:hypothetical protein
MTKRVRNSGLSACKSLDGISVRTTDWGAEVCVSRHDDTLVVTIYPDDCDTPMAFHIPLPANPYLFDPRKSCAQFVPPRSLRVG